MTVKPMKYIRILSYMASNTFRKKITTWVIVGICHLFHDSFFKDVYALL